MKTAIIGWGSLIWDERPEFDEQHEGWQYDGPQLRLEFARVSESRKNALTLVLCPQGGLCQVAYSFSRRNDPDDAICDLRCREGTILKNIGFYFADGSRRRACDVESAKNIGVWALGKSIDVVVWTDLPCNFSEKSAPKKPFTIENALAHIQSLDDEGKAKAAEYVWRAPQFISTPLRKVLQSQPWFPKIG